MPCLPTLFAFMLPNGLTFGTFDVMAAIIAKTHMDIIRFSTFVVLPLTYASSALPVLAQAVYTVFFLCGW